MSAKDLCLSMELHMEASSQDYLPTSLPFVTPQLLYPGGLCTQKYSTCLLRFETALKRHLNLYTIFIVHFYQEEFQNFESYLLIRLR